MTEIIGAINKIILFSAVDGPGNRTAIFLQSCNYCCPYCHNPETIHFCNHCGKCVEGCPVHALSIENNHVIWDEQACVQCDACIKICPHLSSPKILRMTAKQIMEKIGSARSFIRGITVSGGEATLQRDFLIQLFKEARQYGLTTFIDSNGSYDFSQDEELMAVTDSVMLDVKAMLPEEYEEITGQPIDVMLKNVRYLAEQKKLFEIRTVILPELDSRQTVMEASKMIASFPEVRYKLIQYRPFGVREPFVETLSIPSKKDMDQFAALASEQGVADIVIV